MPIELPRGYSGVAMPWKQEIDELVTKLPDGSNQNACIQENSDPPLVIIATYAPMNGSSEKDARYAEFIDEWQEIITK